MASIEKFPSVDMAKLEAEVTGALPIKGALTAEAVMREYESAAKAIEAMGTELISVAKNCEDVRNLIRGTAGAYRQEGRKERFRAYIEGCALFTEDVRRTCETVKRRMMEGSGIA